MQFDYWQPHELDQHVILLKLSEYLRSERSMVTKRVFYNYSSLSLFLGLLFLLASCTAGQKESLKPTESLSIITTQTSPFSISPTIAPSLTRTVGFTATITPPAEPTPGIGSLKIRTADGMKMMYVPAGDFLMGTSDEEIAYILNLDFCKRTNCKKSNFSAAQPQHKVNLDAYWVDQTEVTNAEFAKCVAAGVCKSPAHNTDPGHPEFGDPKYDQYPVTMVTWQQASDYCQWAGGQLPSEAEWEKAARGSDGRYYPWGNTLDKSRMNTCDLNCQALNGRDPKVNDGYAETAPVGSYPAGASPFGALDMLGNVYEYVSDWYDITYYATSPDKNPSGPLTAVLPDSGWAAPCKVVRGGAWDEYNDTISTSYRHCSDGAGTYPCLGFRCIIKAAGQ
jgi:eukaryotic-like serine/threonine-protein kinase